MGSLQQWARQTMCGIAGFWELTPAPRDVLDAKARSMAACLRHRGPDDEGAWSDPTRGLGLGHRRLSIVDLTPEGHQPMLSASGRYRIVFNGEIYNFEELRLQLENAALAPAWRGHSDTEVMLAAISGWGLDEALAKFTGMFAFALWDDQKKTLTLVRDRIGEKPLYYGWTDRGFFFASELKALTAHPDWSGGIDRDALSLYLRFGYVPSPQSIYRDVFKLPPGALLTLARPDQKPHPKTFWSLDRPDSAGTEKFSGGASAAVEQLDNLLRRVVSQQMVADVPLGAFLSGGIDSSTIVAMMQSQSRTPVKTFTIGFMEMAFDEGPFARAIARHLGTDHTELQMTANDAMAVIPELPSIFDEPFGDSSAIPTYLVSRLARQKVTVSLSGDGGDELFGGYNRHLLGPRLWRTLGWLPTPMRRSAAALIRALPVTAWDTSASFLSTAGSGKRRSIGELLYRLSDLVSSGNRDDLYSRFISHWNEAGLVRGAGVAMAAGPGLQSGDLASAMMAADAAGYLPDDILAKMDRAAMRVSLESRMPLVDRRIVEFAHALPVDMKIRNNRGKWILRSVLRRYVPESLTERPKMGFSLPIGVWLRGPLREWAESLVDAGRLEREGFLNAGLVRKKWDEHVSGIRDWQHHLWDVLMFQAWLEEQQRNVR
jgi:asparagine synthase (glutamine-hydrolysing)